MRFCHKWTLRDPLWPLAENIPPTCPPTSPFRAQKLNCPFLIFYLILIFLILKILLFFYSLFDFFNFWIIFIFLNFNLIFLILKLFLFFSHLFDFFNFKIVFFIVYLIFLIKIVRSHGPCWCHEMGRRAQDWGSTARVGICVWYGVTRRIDAHDETRRTKHQYHIGTPQPCAATFHLWRHPGLVTSMGSR